MVKENLMKAREKDWRLGWWGGGGGRFGKLCAPVENMNPSYTPTT